MSYPFAGKPTIRYHVFGGAYDPVAIGAQVRAQVRT